MPTSLPADIVVLLLRASIVVLLYLFLFSMVRVIQRELRAESVARPDAVRGRLIIVDPGTTNRGAGQTISLETVTRLGRSGENTIILDDDFVSASHAIVALHDGRWWVRDAGSTNGTLLNGGTVSGEAVLHSGDELKVGGVRLEVRL